MRIRSARFFLLLVQLAAVGVLASALTASATTTVRWLTLSDGAWPDSVKKVIAAFEAENPGALSSTRSAGSIRFNALVNRLENRY